VDPPHLSAYAMQKQPFQTLQSLSSSDPPHPQDSLRRPPKAGIWRREKENGYCLRGSEARKKSLRSAAGPWAVCTWNHVNSSLLWLASLWLGSRTASHQHQMKIELCRVVKKRQAIICTEPFFFTGCGRFVAQKLFF